MWDNLFSSLSLSSTFALNASIYYLCTIRKCRKEIPKTVKDIKGLPPHSSRILYSEDLQTSLLSYITKQKKVCYRSLISTHAELSLSTPRSINRLSYYTTITINVVSINSGRW